MRYFLIQQIVQILDIFQVFWLSCSQLQGRCSTFPNVLRTRERYLLKSFFWIANENIKPPRYGIDGWDQIMMERDRRITGTIRGQTVCAIRIFLPGPLIRRYRQRSLHQKYSQPIQLGWQKGCRRIGDCNIIYHFNNISNRFTQRL